MITVKIKVGRRRPYLLTDWNHFRVCTTRPLGEQLGQVSKKSDQWLRRRCDNEKKFTDRQTYGWTDRRMDAGQSQYGLSST